MTGGEGSLLPLAPAEEHFPRTFSREDAGESGGEGTAQAAIACIAIAMLLATGCVSGAFDSDLPAQQVFVLNTAPPESRAATVLPVDLTVARPVARPGLDTDRIAVRYPDHRLDYYLASRWSADAEILVQDLLIESLRESGGVQIVHGDISTFASEYVLETELRDFQAEYAIEGRLPAVRVTLVCTLGRLKDRKALATFSASASAPANDNNLRAVVAAFEHAYREVGARIVAETFAALAAAPTTALPAPAGETGVYIDDT